MKLNSSVLKEDKPRLISQQGRVLKRMLLGRWETLASISQNTGDPEASVSRRLREIRASGYRLDKKRLKAGSGTYLYRLLK